MARRLTALVAAVVAFALALTACGSDPGGDRGAGERTTTAVTPDGEATLTVPDGPTVVVPVGAVDADGTLVAERRDDAPIAEGIGTVWDIHLEGATLTGELTITMPYAPASEAIAGALAYYDKATATWTPVVGTLDEAAHTVTATVDHLSWWTPFVWTADAVKTWVADTAHEVWSPPAPDQPTCGDEDGFRSDVTIEADDSDSLLWCAGYEDGAQVVRVMNARSYSVEVNFPRPWAEKDVAPSLGIIDSATRAMADASLFSEQRVIVAPGQTVTVVAPAGSSGIVVVQPSGIAYLLDALVFGFETLAMVTAKVPGGKAKDSAKAGEVFRAAFDSVGCVDDLREFATADVDPNPDDVLDLMTNVIGLSFGCLGEVWKKAYGVDGVWATAVMGVVVWLVSGVRTLVTGIQALWDQFADLDGLQISMAATSQQVDLSTILWHTHGLGLEFTSSSEAVMSAWGCGNQLLGEDCATVLSYVTASSSGSSVTLTVTRASYISTSDNVERDLPAAYWTQYSPPYWGNVGDTLKVRLGDLDGTIEGDGYYADGGSADWHVTFCGDTEAGAAAAETGVCGA